MSNKIEQRGQWVRLAAEVREDDDGVLVEGYAAVFGERANIAGLFEEVIERGAFTDAIGRDDVVFLVNHDGLPLARTRSGTLKLEQDDHGLKMSTRIDPSDPDAQAIIPKMRRGDMDKMSFAFRPEIEEWDDTGDIPLRTIKSASLHDVSIVTDPAYSGTEIGLRSLEQHRETVRRNNFNAARVRVRMKQNLARRENG